MATLVYSLRTTHRFSFSLHLHRHLFVLFFLSFKKIPYSWEFDICTQWNIHAPFLFLVGIEFPPQSVLPPSPLLLFLFLSLFFLLFLINNYVWLVLPIGSWVWDHLLEDERPNSSHNLKKEWFPFFSQFSACSSSSGRGGAWRKWQPMSGFWLFLLCACNHSCNEFNEFDSCVKSSPLTSSLFLPPLFQHFMNFIGE